jgi:transposase
MYVAVSGSGKAKVIQFREDKRIPGTNKKTTKVIKTLGNYERMVAEDPDIIAKLKAQAKALTKQKKEFSKPLSLQVTSTEITEPDDVVPSYYFGHCLIKQLWNQMKLDVFFTSQCGRKNAETVAQALFYLVAHRCAAPDSIRACVLEQSSFAGLSPLGLDVFYGVLDVLAEQKETVITHLCAFFEKRTDRRGTDTYLDVTTYAFESTRWGELRMFGFSKDHKNNEVQVVMALLLDNKGIPITYELFPGNTMDQNTLVETVEKLKNIYQLDKITIVADRGMNGGENLIYLDKNGYDFIISYTLKRSTDAFKELVFEEEGWQDTWDDKHKEVIYREKAVNQTLKVKVPILQETIKPTDKKKRGRPRKYEEVEIPVKIHLTWSAKRARKDKADRERVLERLRKRLDKPYQLKASIKRGCNQYLQMAVDTKDWTLDEEKIQQAERFDGYYAIVTNNLNLSTDQVCQAYRGIWKIEESFRILKTDLRACPVFVWNDNHIKGHFMMCFISLCLLRYIQYLLETQCEIMASAEVIMEAIKEPLVLVQGDYPHNVVTPTKISKVYLELAKLMKLPTLRTNMTLTQFRSSTKLDLNINLK